MKNLLILVSFLSVNFCFSQKDNAFKEDHPRFSNCINAEDKLSCFDDTIIAHLLKYAEPDIRSYFKKFPERKDISLYSSFIINDSGEVIDKSVRVSKFKDTDIETILKKAIAEIPRIYPVRNENDHPLLSSYSIYFDVIINKFDEIEVLEKRKIWKDTNDASTFIAPQHPNCRKLNNSAARDCLSNEVRKIITKKFNVNKAMKGFTKEGSFNIFVLFNINKEGQIDDISAYGPNKNFSDQALKAVSKIKKVKPGTKDGNPVNVPYQLPIKFKI